MTVFSWLGKLHDGQETDDLIVYLNLLFALQVECEIALMHVIDIVERNPDPNAVKISFNSMREQNNYHRVYVGEILDDIKFRIRSSMPDKLP